MANVSMDKNFITGIILTFVIANTNTATATKRLLKIEELVTP